MVADVLICLPDYSFVTLLMAFYSYIPMLLFLSLIAWLIISKTTRPLLGIVGYIVAVILNEAILKNIFRQARPAGTCALSYGMPSGHSAISFMFLTWVILECVMCIFRWDLNRKVAYSSLALILFVPVPYSRIYLLYHTVAQVGVGMSIGFIMGVCYFVLLRVYLMNKLPLLAQYRYTAWIKNTYIKEYMLVTIEDGASQIEFSVFDKFEPAKYEN